MYNRKKPRGSQRIVTVDCISGKWKPTILYYLKDGPMRYTELCKLIPQVSKKVLTEQLRELESVGLVKREALNDEVPKGMEYSLTEISWELASMVRSLHEWGIKQACRKNITLKPIKI